MKIGITGKNKNENENYYLYKSKNFASHAINLFALGVRFG